MDVEFSRVKMEVSEQRHTEGTAIEGEAFVVGCPQADPDDNVTWHFAETGISTDKGERVHSSGVKLWFLPTALQDSGNYTCKYKDDPNESKTVSVKIHPYKKDNCYYKDALYIESIGSPDSGRIPCPSLSNYKNASHVRWYKDCQPVQGPKYKSEAGWLYISQVTETDTGVYTCKFTYSHGGQKFTVSASKNFRIEGLSWPTLIEVHSPKDNEVIYAETGKYMLPNQGQFTETILTIKKVEKKDFNATFSCVLGNDRGYKIVNVILHHKGPSKGHSNIPLVVGFVVFFVAIAIMVMLYHFFRIDIVLFCRRIFNCIESKDDGKIYDAYVICPTNHVNGTCENNFVSCFVHQILPEVLENHCGYKLCIYGRDVLPGEDAIVAVETRIKASRRLIVLITQSLVQCKDFVWDHQIGFYNALVQNNMKVILLEMEKMGDSAQLQESLRHIMNKQGTIKWKEKYMPCPSSPHSDFWKHVEYHMPVRRKHRPAYSIVYNGL
ncbi:interleukin-1 receptor-like 1 [Tiliqua scincoides]|uniref:interleukin-1 receptor-like 1 n=1 Tax=Tiliqua scincoides TaxID=71010 RepID=UPI003462F704